MIDATAGSRRFRIENARGFKGRQLLQHVLLVRAGTAGDLPCVVFRKQRILDGRKHAQCIGDGAGAIIDLKNVSGGDKGNKARRYYALGAEVYGGFLLDSVAEKSVILKRKNETLELKIDRSRYAAAVGKNKAQPPAQTVPPPVQPPRTPPPPVGSPVTRGPGMPPPGVNL